MGRLVTRPVRLSWSLTLRIQTRLLTIPLLGVHARRHPLKVKTVFLVAGTHAGGTALGTPGGVDQHAVAHGIRDPLGARVGARDRMEQNAGGQGHGRDARRRAEKASAALVDLFAGIIHRHSPFSAQGRLGMPRRYLRARRRCAKNRRHGRYRVRWAAIRAVGTVAWQSKQFSRTAAKS